MDLKIILDNILSPPILFFFLGVFAVFVKSNLDIPHALAQFFTLYLLMDIGFKGGHELFLNGFSPEIVKILGACMLMAFLIPVYAYFILRMKFSIENSAALAATYGSVSAVTFVSTSAFLDYMKVKSGGYMVAGMALMEAPAIIIGVIIYQYFLSKENKGAMIDEAELALSGGKVSDEYTHTSINWGHLLNDAFFNGSVLLLLGSLLIGYVTGKSGWKSFESFDAIFKGILAFYLLDNCMIAARQIRDLKGNVFFLLGFGILFPLFNAILGILICKYILFTGVGDALLFTVLCASASYIAVPAAMRLAIPKANPALTVPVALGITFPFNVIVGIPTYYNIILALWK
jgi:hypothetical protein